MQATKVVARAAQENDVAASLGGSLGLFVGLLGFLPPADDLQYFGPVDVGIYGYFLVLLMDEFFNQALVEVQGLLILKISAGVVGGFAQVFNGILLGPGLLVVESQVDVPLFDVVTVEFADRPGDLKMKLLEAGSQLHTVDRFAQEAVAEDVAQLVHRAPDLSFLGHLDLFA